MQTNLSMAFERVTMLMPMHLLAGPDGEIRSCGPTLRKLIGRARNIHDVFELRRTPADANFMATLKQAADHGERVFLGLKESPLPPLRGEASQLTKGEIFINLGFGIGVIEAITTYDLTDADFAANDLAIEMLYLHSSNQAIRSELARHSFSLEEARQVAEMQAFTDPLTGLLNRRGFDLALGRALEARAAPAARRQEFALLQLDLDWFKDVNDRFGHPTGDAVLRQIAEVLRRETRTEDAVARVGGDEFMVLLPGMASESTLLQLGHRLIAATQEPIPVDANICHVSASIGATMSQHYETVSAETMLADGDSALYSAKRSGRGCIRLHGSHVAKR
ncbi:MAG TPA: GGDEF domain-containing protein [Paracoccus sp. (in: a-proteobacteria)]|uniref:GGDEF domain-containing protein n=1 Tax=uncultured Paracoccus sp. TaxID=189685 RepID=UPI0026035316|nr:GGDEF domain-containing protein [uncultured Paracoccus sp.]HMQ40724.1 GGDEF domain-containing protein [Paracoccus sp. (in: a-proteobacteria)]HMR37622.1 GGDEF domain-containing protein [Paracoccus sp. (in: a-proteobacteria)]